MSSTAVPDRDTVVPCGGHKNELDGCSKLFPLRDQSEDLCPKCQAVDAAESPADKSEAEVRDFIRLQYIY